MKKISAKNLEIAKKLINEFCQCEYGENGDFEDLEKIGLAYTSFEDEEDSDYEIQVNLNLLTYTLTTLKDNIIVEVIQYKDFKDLKDNLLEHMSFDSLVNL